MKIPVVSVVMVMCNVDRFLAEAIESILGQTFRDFEFIIVDYGSIDKSKDIASHYATKDRRIRLHEIPHCSLAEARNAGCFFAQGRYIAIQDADDVSLPNRLMWEINFMEKHPEVGVLGGAVEWIDARGKTLLTFDDYPTEDHEIRVAFTSYCPIWQPAVLVRRNAFTNVGGYRAAFVPTEDYDLWLRISEHAQIANLKQVLVKYRIHPDQVSLRKRKQQTLGRLAAQASAVSRGNGKADPLNAVEEVTPALLVGLGVSEATQQSALAEDYKCWILNMYMAGEHTAALNAAVEMLRSSDWEHAEQRSVADVHTIAARIYWRQKRFFHSFLATSHAVMTRPKMIGRPLKPLLRRLGLA